MPINYPRADRNPDMTLNLKDDLYCLDWANRFSIMGDIFSNTFKSSQKGQIDFGMIANLNCGVNCGAGKAYL